MANNYDWLGTISLIDYLRDVGKHFTVPYMLAKDSVQTRLERGLSFTEFSYMTLQAFDFLTLYREHGVEMQMGGADQWGNITAGLELIRRTSGGEADESPAHGIAYKLLLSPSGAKFGKSEGGDSVWLDPARTTPYAFYQYWVNVDDRDIGTYMRWFTTWDRDEIEALDAAVAAAPEAREAQRRLAVRRDRASPRRGRGPGGRRGLAGAVPAGADQRPGAAGIGLRRRRRGDGDARRRRRRRRRCSSPRPASRRRAGEARRLVQGGAITVNGVRIADPAAALPEAIAGEWLEVRVGKRNRSVVRIAPG